MDLFTNKYIISNLTIISSYIILAFIIAFFLTPLCGRLAKRLEAVDLPARLRRKTERGLTTRIHDYAYPKLGGLATVLAIILTLVFTGTLSSISKGVIIGIIIITIIGFLDDKFEINSRWQLLGQVAAAAVIVIAGITIKSLNFAGTEISFNWLSGVIHFAQYTYNFVFPADLITVVWIVGMINVINWVGGVDALNGSITSIALFTLMLLNLANGNLAIAALIGIHLGAVLGVLPFNYPPGKIMYGSIGDFLNGYLLAIFAILGGTKWTATLIVLGMPILDGIFVVITRFRTNPELMKSPLKILQISDKNHLHHRLLAAGYSKKTVTLLETAMMAVVCAVALYFSDIRKDALAFILGIIFIFVAFTVVFFLKKRNEKRDKIQEIMAAREAAGPQKEAVVKVIFENQKKKEEKEEEKFIY